MHTNQSTVLRVQSNISGCICSTSLFVACCEALLGRKLQGIVRTPASARERAENVQAVLWELSHNVLHTDLSHISGQGVVSQDPTDVHNLLEILSALLMQDNQHDSIGTLFGAFLFDILALRLLSKATRPNLVHSSPLELSSHNSLSS